MNYGIFHIGQVFNCLTIIKLSHIDKRGRKHFLCRCRCGKEKTIQGSLMTSGNTKSCGCFGTELRKATRISINHSEVTAIILGYKRHAKNRGFDFLLSREFVAEIIKLNCHYCGCNPGNIKVTKNSISGGLMYNGIDRIDSNGHYVNDNVVPCCSTCNLAKRAMTKEQFLDWIKRVYNYQISMGGLIK